MLPDVPMIGTSTVGGLAGALALAITVSISLPARGGVLEDLLAKPVDQLSYGLDTLETRLRLYELELCSRARCDRETRIRVKYLSPDADFPEGFQMPPDGAIIIEYDTTRTGDDPWAGTPERCKDNLLFEKSGLMVGSSSNPARFFIPRKKWAEIMGPNTDSETVDKLEKIGDQIFLFLIETHKWLNAKGLTVRTVYVACFVPLHGSDDDIQVLFTGQHPE